MGQCGVVEVNVVSPETQRSGFAAEQSKSF